MPTIVIKRLILIGTGLIGGSFSLALKHAGVVGEVVGIGRRRETLEEAKRLNIIDSLGGYDRASFAGADLVLVATPVGQMRSVFAAMAPWLPPQAIVTDGGSTKQDVVALARELLPAALARMVPAHPIAGTERNGPEAAFPELYHGRRVILTPLPETSDDSLATVRAAWEACGAQVSTLVPQVHDAMLSAVSHLPHLLAFALVDELAARPEGRELFSFAGGGFRDFTRIASSNPEMWRDIFLSNREAVSRDLVRYREKLAEFQRLLDAGNGNDLEESFRRSQGARERWLRKD